MLPICLRGVSRCRSCYPENCPSPYRMGVCTGDSFLWWIASPLAESMRTVAGFCVATISQAMSVNVSTVRPLEDMTGARIAVPNEAPTAVKLLQVLLSLRHGVEPAELVSSQDPHDGILLVGTQGLRYRRVAREFPHQYDLGEEWYRWDRSAIRVRPICSTFRPGYRNRDADRRLALHQPTGLGRRRVPGLGPRWEPPHAPTRNPTIYKRNSILYRRSRREIHGPIRRVPGAVGRRIMAS